MGHEITSMMSANPALRGRNTQLTRSMLGNQTDKGKELKRKESTEKKGKNKRNARRHTNRTDEHRVRTRVQLDKEVKYMCLKRLPPTLGY